MKSRDQILNRVKLNQPSNLKQDIHYAIGVPSTISLTERFKEVATSVGTSILEINSATDLIPEIDNCFPNKRNVMIHLPPEMELKNILIAKELYADLDVAVLKGEFAVAENGAIWITNENVPDRSVPFICENLVLIVNEEDIVPTLYEAYKTINNRQYQYATFIAGPSKTADIEQSLVLGAHGPKTLTIFILKYSN